jgi:hypothetical protein
MRRKLWPTAERTTLAASPARPLRKQAAEMTFGLNALRLRGMERIKFEAALALLLRADLRGPAKREGECLLWCWLALYLAADVADDP